MFSGMMLGFQEVIIDQLINNTGHVTISARDEMITPGHFENVFFPDVKVRWLRPPAGRYDSSSLTNAVGWYRRLEQDERVISYAPQLSRQAMLINGTFNVAVSLTGLNPARQKLTTTLEKYIITGKLDDLSRSGGSVILGSGLINRLGTRVGETVSAQAPGLSPSPLKIIGELRTGNRFIDETAAYASIPTVSKLTASSGQITSIIVKLNDVEKASAIAEDWARLGHDRVESWDQANEGIMSVFTTQDIVRRTINFVIALIIAFGIYNILNMVVNHKKRDIAILKSMGYGTAHIIRLFLLQGSLLGFSGAAVGLAIGFGGCLWMSTLTFAGGRMSGGTAMMISFNPMIYVYGFMITSISSIVASYLPARMAARLEPIDIIRGAT